MDEFRFDSGENIFFTSDTHWGHENIIKFCDRPFSSVEEMNKIMIENWNNTISDNDIVFHLGDFALGGSKLWNNILHALNGKHYLIIGNHDEKNIRQGYKDLFEKVLYQMNIYVDGHKLVLNHYPLLAFAGCYDKNRCWNLHGHCHLSKYKNEGKDFNRLQYCFPTQYDVGVDLNNFTPISFQKVKERIEFQIENNVNELYWINHELN